MSVEAVRWALYQAPARDLSERMILVYLAERADSTGAGTYPSASTMATAAGVDVRTVRRHLQQLEARGVIRRGDKAKVARTRADRRPIVWDLAMSGTGAVDPVRGDTDVLPCSSDGVTQASYRDGPRGDTDVLPSELHGVTCTSPEPSALSKIEKQPPPGPVDAQVDQPRQAAIMVRAGGGGDLSPDTVTTLDLISEREPLGVRDRGLLAPAVGAALGRGWTPPALAAHLVADPGDPIRIRARFFLYRLDRLPESVAVCGCTACRRGVRVLQVERERRERTPPPAPVSDGRRRSAATEEALTRFRLVNPARVGPARRDGAVAGSGCPVDRSTGRSPGRHTGQLVSDRLRAVQAGRTA
jgi:Helix-turn-helix domain